MTFTFEFNPVPKDNLISILTKVERSKSALLGSSHTVFNLPHIFIARQLILTNEKIIIAPSFDPSYMHLIIIGESVYMRQPEINNRIRKLKLTVLATGKCSQGDLERALKFTVQTRLSGQWAQCSDLLLQGYEFLNPAFKASISGVKVNFLHTETSLKMILKQESVHLPEFDLKRLGIAPEVVANFLNTSDSFITDDFVPNRFVHVLPTMKKGEIVEIRKSLPLGCPFNSYEELKVYWLSLYGFKLPQNESDIVYVQVLFRLISSEPLTYPSCCIRIGGLRPAPSLDQPANEAVRQFMRDTLRFSRRLLTGYELHLIDTRSMSQKASQKRSSAEADGETSYRDEGSNTNDPHCDCYSGSRDGEGFSVSRVSEAYSASRNGEGNLVSRDGGRDTEESNGPSSAKQPCRRQMMGYASEL